MTSSRWRSSAAMVCLVVGPLAMLAQFIVTPVPGGNASVADTLEAVAESHAAMAWALVLDVPVMLAIPALFVAGLMAGAARSRLAAIATALTVLPSIAAVVLLAQDALIYVASQQADRGAAVALVQDFVHNPFIAFATFGYLLVHLVAFPLLALALRRAGVLPSAIAIAFGAWPVVEVLGYGSGAKPIAVAGYFFQFAALAVCAVRLRSSRPAGAVPAKMAHAIP